MYIHKKMYTIPFEYKIFNSDKYNSRGL